MILGIDIGGTKTLVGKFSKSGRLIRKYRFLTNCSLESFLAELTKAKGLFNLRNVTAVSIAIPGTVEDDQFIKLGNLKWKKFDIVAYFKDLYGVPVFLDNDANIGGLSEAEGVVGTSVYLTFSTGIGAGVIRNGKIWSKFKNYEPGHNKYLFHGQRMEWEDIAAASALNKFYKKPITQIVGAQNWKDIADRMAIGIYDVEKDIKPNHIFIGGPIALRYGKLIKHLAPMFPDIKFHKAKKPGTAVLYGCYIYAKQRLKK